MTDRIPNSMLIETWGTHPKHRFGDVKGSLRPCKTRPLVDQVMDLVQDRLVQYFPEWQGRFRRESRVIINGDAVCNGIES